MKLLFLKTTNQLVKELEKITSEFIFVEWYSHESSDCYKIVNVYTDFGKDTIVLCKRSDGIRLALKLAIIQIHKCFKEYYGYSFKEWEKKIGVKE